MWTAVGFICISLAGFLVGYRAGARDERNYWQPRMAGFLHEIMAVVNDIERRAKCEENGKSVPRPENCVTEPSQKPGTNCGK